MGPLDKLPDSSKFKSYNTNEYGVGKVSKMTVYSTIMQILTQITVGLHILQFYLNFTSGDLKAGNIFVKSDPINMTYMSIPIKSSFTCKIADYGKSSCTIYKENRSDRYGIRFYNESKMANLYLKFHPFKDDIISDEHGDYFYTIGSILNAQLYTRTRHMGVPFYYSFDYYTVLVSMLTNPSFFYPFFGSPTLLKIFWDPIWKEGDGNIILEKIKYHAGRAVR